MNFYIALPLVAVLLNVILVILVLRRARGSFLHQVCALFLIIMGTWAFAVFTMRASSSLEEAFTWQKVCVAVAPLGAVLYYHFTILLTRATLRKGVLASGYLLTIPLIALVHTGLLITGTQVKPYGYAPVLGSLFFLFIAFMYAFVLLGLLNLVKALRTSTSQREKNRAGYVITGTVFFLLGGITDFLPPLGLPVYPLGIVGNILFCSLVAIAILRYRLLDIQIVVRKGLAYSLLSALVVGVYVGFILLLNLLFRVQEVSLALSLPFAIVLAMILQPVLGRIQRFVDKWFYRQRYDHLRALVRFSQETKSIIDVGNLSSSLIRMVTLAMQTEKARLLLPSPASSSFTAAPHEGSHNPQLLTLPDNHPIILWLSRNEGFLSRQDLDVIPQLKSLTEREKPTLEGAEIDLYIPVKTQRGLAGVLILGPKLGDQPYSTEDLELLLTVTNQAAIGIENAGLYAELKRQLEELHKTQAQLIRSAKLAAVGELAANVAHEINNPLQSILNYSFLLSQRVSEKDPSKADVEALENEVLRAQSIVRSLLDFARRDEPRKEQVQVNALLQSVIPLAKLRTEASGIKLIEDYAPDLAQIGADAEQLKQVFLNLITNALDAMPNGGKLSIVTRNHGEHLTIIFSDTGKGIPQQDLAKVFDPFFTTKPKGKGTGLGLTVSLGIIESHGGTITVSSEQGKGSAFTVTLLTRSTREVVDRYA